MKRFKALLLGYALLLIVSSLFWKLHIDLPILLYIAQAIHEQHLVPYRDIFDMNMPGSYGIYYLLTGIFGYSDLGIRLADLSVLALISLLAYRWLRPLSRTAAFVAPLCFVIFYLSQGPYASLQREYLGLVPLNLALLLVFGSSRLSPSIRLPLLGACASMALLIKPHLVLLFIPVTWYALVAQLERAGARTRGPELLGFAARYGAGALVPIALALGWLQAHGALEAFWELAHRYWPLYGGMNHDHRVLAGVEKYRDLLNRWLELGGYTLWLVPAAVGWFFLLQNRPKEVEALRLYHCLGGCLVASVVYPTVSGQFWPYHWMPFAFVVICLGTLVLRGLSGGQLEHQWPRVGLVVVALMATSVPVWLVGQATRGLAQPDKAWQEGLASWLETHLKPGETVQPLDWTGGAVHAMYLAHAPLATRFVYDFHFYHHVDSPYIQGLRRELLTGLEARKPRFILEVIDRPWPEGVSTTREFLELQQLLHQHYAVVKRESAYRLWERAPTST